MLATFLSVTKKFQSSVWVAAPVRPREFVVCTEQVWNKQKNYSTVPHRFLVETDSVQIYVQQKNWLWTVRNKCRIR
jgi:hypothetical protein